jgi:Cys-tRNA(Pro)/Cys-tRNA(Cys) deacylase
MLFPRNALTPGPQVCFFAEKVKKKRKGGKLDSSLERKGRKRLHWDNEAMTKPIKFKDEVFTRALKELSEARIPHRVMTFKAEEKSAEEVTRETGFPLARVVKTLLVQGASKKYYLALCPGNRQVNLKNLARALGEKTVDMAKREEVPKITGYFIGGVSPIGTHRPLPVVLEQSILGMPEIAISAGQWGCQAVLRPWDLREFLGSRATLASFAQAEVEN